MPAQGGRLAVPHRLSLASLAVGVTSAVLLLLAAGRATRPVLAAMLVVGAIAGYFTARYGVVIDKHMLSNVAETDPAEAAELISLRLLVILAVLGVLPAFLILRTSALRAGLPIRRFRLVYGRGNQECLRQHDFVCRLRHRQAIDELSQHSGRMNTSLR